MNRKVRVPQTRRGTEKAKSKVAGLTDPDGIKRSNMDKPNYGGKQEEPSDARRRAKKRRSAGNKNYGTFRWQPSMSGKRRGDGTQGRGERGRIG